MTKRSGIAIRISEDLRDKFNQWCKDHNIKASEHLRRLIELSIDGVISPDLNKINQVNLLDNSTAKKVSQLEKEVSILSSKLSEIEEKK